MKIRDILSKERLLILLIFIIAFFLRISYSFSAKVVPYVDAKHYDRIAKSISAGKGYTEGDNLWDDERALSCTPFYPFLLAIFYKIFGHRYSVIWIFQAIVSAISCILVYLIAKKVFGQKVAIFSIIICAISFTFILYTAMLLTETIYIFFVLFFFLLFFDIIKCGSLLKYAILGILAGITILTKAIFVGFTIFLFFCEFKRRSFKKALVFIACVGLIILPWIIRNYMIYRHFIFISTAAADTFATGNHSKANGTGGESAVPEEIKTNPQNLSPLELIFKSYHKSIKFVIQNPIREFILILKKISLFFSPLRTDGWWFHMKGWHRIFALIFSFLFSLFLFSIGTIGFIFSYRNNNSYKFWMRSFIIISFLSLLPFIVEARYRFPVYPFMIIFASYGLTLLPQIKTAIKLKEEKIIIPLRISMILITLLLFNFIYDSMVNLEEVMSRIKLLF